MPEPVSEEYLQLVYTGGSNNNDPSLSLGGAYGQSFIFDPNENTLEELLQKLAHNVTMMQQRDGYTYYRCIGVRNTHTDGTMYTFQVKLSKTDGGDCLVYIGWDPAGINQSPQTIATETVAPQNVTWIGAGQTLVLPETDLGPQETKGLWIKIVVPAGAKAMSFEYFNMQFEWGRVGA
jgi:hypothetical protein